MTIEIGILLLVLLGWAGVVLMSLALRYRGVLALRLKTAGQLAGGLAFLAAAGLMAFLIAPWQAPDGWVGPRTLHGANLAIAILVNLAAQVGPQWSGVALLLAALLLLNAGFDNLAILRLIKAGMPLDAAAAVAGTHRLFRRGR
jgi:hypothetical protein